MKGEKMEDREMLMLAAKAAGYTVNFEPHMSIACDDGIYFTHDRGYPAKEREGSHWWNPLLDDGDALRLAVRLRLNIMFDGAFHKVSNDRRTFDICEIGGIEEIKHAIVRAAAEIGKSL